MRDNIFDQDETVSLNMPWSMLCRLAVAERCSGMPIEKIVEQALIDYLERGGRKAAGGTTEQETR